ncbi:MAG TPA: helix-turn-helix domain-containing protein [Sulfuricaulis sp.]|nr:helix-turn-helix domain-containing protein [Sulfuricaulis sp.]
MTARDDERRSSCPIACSLDILGDKWTMLLIRDMVLARKRHFREFLESPEGIASNILTDRLKRLEESGIVSRQPDPESARQVIYTLTEKGKDLIPALLELARWGAKHVARSVPPKNIARRIKEDRDGLIEELKSSLK